MAFPAGLFPRPDFGTLFWVDDGCDALYEGVRPGARSAKVRLTGCANSRVADGGMNMPKVAISSARFIS